MGDLLRRSEPGERTQSDLNALIQDALVLTRRKCQDQGIEVIWQPESDLPKLSLAVDRLQQAFLNILMNAIEAMPDGGQLAVHTARTTQPEGARITLADTGDGIREDHLSQLFQPFFSTKAEGLGLGLYTCRNIVEEHGGWIEVESELDQGTTFTIWLPISADLEALL
jgi:signal transduction histidine kinase